MRNETKFEVRMTAAIKGRQYDFTRLVWAHDSEHARALAMDAQKRIGGCSSIQVLETKCLGPWTNTVR